MVAVEGMVSYCSVSLAVSSGLALPASTLGARSTVPSESSPPNFADGFLYFHS